MGAWLERRYCAASVRGTLHGQLGEESQDCYGVAGTADGRWSVFGVFDGHGRMGRRAAEIARRGLVEGLVRRLEQAEEALPEEALQEGGAASASAAAPGEGAGPDCGRGRLVEKVVREVFGEVAKEIDAMDWAVGSGTTATVAIVGPGRCVIANVGDSNAILARRAPGSGNRDAPHEALPACPEHRVRAVPERRRLRALGARFSGEYLLGADGTMTSVTRALGDLELRPVGLINTPDVTHWPLTDCHRFLIMATDGLWDAYEGDISPQAAVDLVVRHLAKSSPSSSPKIPLSSQLCKMAGHPDPLDDCTVLTVFFH